MEVLVDDVLNYVLVNHCDLLVVLTMALTCKRYFALVSGHPLTTTGRVFRQRADGMSYWRDMTHGFWMSKVFFKFGSLDLLKRMLPSGGFDVQRSFLEHTAWMLAPAIVAKRGDVAILDWMFHSNAGENFIFGQRTTNIAARCGHWHVLQWLSEKHRLSLSIDTLAHACVSGNLPMIQWLRNEGVPFERCFSDQMDFIAIAIQYGHMDVIRWIHSQRTVRWILYPFTREISVAIEHKRDAIRDFFLDERTRVELKFRGLANMLRTGDLDDDE